MTQIPVPPPIRVFFIVDFAFGIAYLFNYLVGEPYWTLTVLLDLDGEGNLPTWYSSIQWFCVAMLFGLFAHRNFSRSQRKSWGLLILPLVFLLLSLDEIAQLHEVLGSWSDRFLPNASRKDSLFSRTGVWMFVIGVPFVAFFGAMMLSIRGYFERAPGAYVKVLIGMAIMLIGALGIESLSNFVGSDPFYSMLQTIVEELCEILGGTIVLWGSYELLLGNGFAFGFDTGNANHAVPPCHDRPGHR
jgi:hypothetical protein